MLAICQQTRQIIAYTIGDRSEQSAGSLYERIPAEYKNLRSYSDH